MKRLRSILEYRAEAAELDRQRGGEHPENRARDVEYERNRRRNDPSLQVMENLQRQARKSMGGANDRFHREFLSTEFVSGEKVGRPPAKESPGRER